MKTITDGHTTTLAKRAPSLTEAQIQRQIIDYLIARQIKCWRIQQKGIKGRSVTKHRAGSVGMSDIHAIHEGRSIWLEVKGKDGRVSEAQASFIRSVNKAGGLAAVVRSVDDVATLLGGIAWQQ